MVARLEPFGEGPVIPLERPIILIGRHPECDVRIDSHKISRRHCCIVQLQDKLVIRDLGSTNGIYRNGQRVEEAELTPQDEIQIANLRYQLVPDRANGGVAPPNKADGAISESPRESSSPADPVSPAEAAVPRPCRNE